jgi:hypothetical protein
MIVIETFERGRAPRGGSTSASSGDRFGTDRLGGTGYPRPLVGAGDGALRHEQTILACV